MEEIRLSVRVLAEFLLHSGSIDNRFGGNDRALEGARIHRMLQKQAGPDYRSEVFLSEKTERHGFLYKIEGRADGIISTGQGTLIDEIKTTAMPLEMIAENDHREHWGQAMCYGYMFARQNILTGVTVQLTYFNIDTEEIKRFQRELSFQELENFWMDLLDQYERWASLKREWKIQRNDSLKGLPFPFQTYRAGQRKMATAVYQTVALAKEQPPRLFCQAPTGIGKTISAIFPAVKAIGEDKAERLFYLTAKTITRQAAEEAFTRLRGQGMRLKTVTLTAKDKVCFQPVRDCNPEKCPYADGYYDRVNDAIFELLSQRDHMTREVLEACGREYQICPFELALDLTLWCDGIVCDYNYLFDPVVSLKRFFGDGVGGDYVFLIDEAHNLVDRAREMYSAELRQSQFQLLRRVFKKAGEDEKSDLLTGRLLHAAKKMEDTFNLLKDHADEEDVLREEAVFEAAKEDGETERESSQNHNAAPADPLHREPPGSMLQACRGFTAVCEEWMERNKQSSSQKETVLEVYFAARFFLKIWDIFDQRFTTVVGLERGDVQVKLLCLDPSKLLSDTMDLGRASILFSATLTPGEYYASVLGGTEKARAIELSSPYAQDRFGLYVADYISTKYADRSNTSPFIVSLLEEMIQARPGNYLAFFPSYKYMNDVAQAFQAAFPQRTVAVQSTNMSEEEREEFLSGFTEESCLLGFCVLGGIFSEGVDLKGNRLIGAAIVGVGLPTPDQQVELLRGYYDRQCGQGFAYACRYPGMNKVLQAAGRVIRGAEDRGIVLLIDSRFSRREYRQLFPAHWRHAKIIRNQEDFREELQAFWE